MKFEHFIQRSGEQKVKELKYFTTKVHSKFSTNRKETISSYFRKAGMKIGGGCNICCNIMTPEPYLIDIGNNVTIAGYVHFVTHDNSINKVCHNKSDFFGGIKIGDDCFIGQGSLILYGVTLAPRIIVAAGSVVTRSFNESGIIIGGNPARKIGTWDKLRVKGEQFGLNVSGMTYDEKRKYICESNDLIIK